jgi:hypothetical protein
MKNTLSYSIILLPALISLPIAQMSAAPRTTSKVRHTIIAASGSAAPAGGSFTPLILNATVNPRHEVAFDAFVGGPPFTTGVFVGDGKTTSTIALGANPDPTAPSFGSVFNPFIMPNGNVVFDVNFRDVLMSDGRTIVALSRDGDPAPGGGTLTPKGGSRAVNDRGVIAYSADVNGATATLAIVRTDGTQSVAIARDDIAPPTGGRFTALFTPVMNDRGQVAFKSEMTAGAADNGIFRGEGGELTPMFVENQIVPGGATVQDFGGPLINRHGQVAALVLLKNSAIVQGIFVGDGTDTVAIALEGQTAPEGGSYKDPSSRRQTFGSPIRLNDRGEVAFHANLTGGTSAGGIFRGAGERTTTIALQGAIAPGTTGIFESFGDTLLGNDGRVAFIAMLAPGAGGVDSSNNLGIWIGTSDEDLQLVVRTGDVIAGRVLTSLPFFGFAFGHQFEMNENGVLWIGGFGPGKAVIFSRILGDDAVVAEQK